MDLTQLVTNIEKARDAAREDRDAFAQQADEAKHNRQTGDMLAANIARAAAEAVEVALSRILGESRTRAD